MINIKFVGEIIAAERKGLKLTQIQLGEMLNVSHQAVSKWERGECLPGIDILVLLAKIFNIKVDQLLAQQEIGNIAPNIWDSVLEIITNQISQPSFDQWFLKSRAVHLDNSLIISGHNQFATNWLYQRYSSLILKVVNQLVGNYELKIIFRFSEDSNNTRRTTLER
ncbi:helix-turn-helix domain-containing protein [Paenibacillus koleovorans]|uniref:helix-turn-helix domain-containing protein n=1 Tax=Paenibacillus koleovorans TaxID=121608 RepID=UPI0013E3E0B3|nr:helix-turn-helix transcriptional regulator [Paenibacillus koleovorans]